MKKILYSLCAVVLVTTLVIAVTYAYNNYKNLELKKEEAKVVKHKSQNESSKKNKNTDKANHKKHNVDKSDQPDVNNTDKASNEETTSDHLGTNEENNQVKKTENGIDYVDDFDAPIDEAQYEKEVMSQSGGGPTEDEAPSNQENMSDEQFINAYKEGMTQDEANAVNELAKDPAYIDYLRGQVEARENGQGGNY
ncbi:hypothetical protein FOG31_10670 [Staphylococcus aureus]|uniref:hypothetical protein n=1 Tax=Staphylococcus aureus TaxID=1280 RepID=UPI001CF563DD|nr:hypothetical protein [Staphylococcus aureus]MBZ8162525.1 hypothetical protein [Staphylococcus aureus]MBZ8165341.1 hypothetical protein [Staphylococcus aureus]MBZ8168074.1 hypothetical protein [Staphylococcus aureus]MBZ8170674.1 hypothetical protein [Staphylococcus aureus]